MHQPIPLQHFTSKVPAGFPSPADDYFDAPLSLHDHLVKRPAATLFVRLKDDAMRQEHFHPGDLLVVDRSVKPTDGRIVVARVAGDLMLRRLVVKGKACWLIAASPDYPAIELKDGLEYQILGVVLHRIHSC